MEGILKLCSADHLGFCGPWGTLVAGSWLEALFGCPGGLLTALSAQWTMRARLDVGYVDSNQYPVTDRRRLWLYWSASPSELGPRRGVVSRWGRHVSRFIFDMAPQHKKLNTYLKNCRDKLGQGNHHVVSC